LKILIILEGAQCYREKAAEWIEVSFLREISGKAPLISKVGVET
jgi:hypothetical protein